MDTSQAHLDEQLTDILESVNTGFETLEHCFDDLEQAVENRFDRLDQRFDRLEKIIDNWPAPSVIKDLLVRVSVLERKAGIKPHPSHAA